MSVSTTSRVYSTEAHRMQVCCGHVDAVRPRGRLRPRGATVGVHVPECVVAVPAPIVARTPLSVGHQLSSSSSATIVPCLHLARYLMSDDALHIRRRINHGLLSCLRRHAQ